MRCCAPCTRVAHFLRLKKMFSQRACVLSSYMCFLKLPCALSAAVLNPVAQRSFSFPVPLPPTDTCYGRCLLFFSDERAEDINKNKKKHHKYLTAANEA